MLSIFPISQTIYKFRERLAICYYCCDYCDCIADYIEKQEQKRDEKKQKRLEKEQSQKETFAAANNNNNSNDTQTANTNDSNAAPSSTAPKVITLDSEAQLPQITYNNRYRSSFQSYTSHDANSVTGQLATRYGPNLNKTSKNENKSHTNQNSSSFATSATLELQPSDKKLKKPTHRKQGSFSNSQPSRSQTSSNDVNVQIKSLNFKKNRKTSKRGRRSNINANNRSSSRVSSNALAGMTPAQREIAKIDIAIVYRLLAALFCCWMYFLGQAANNTFIIFLDIDINCFARQWTLAPAGLSRLFIFLFYLERYYVTFRDVPGDDIKVSKCCYLIYSVLITISVMFSALFYFFVLATFKGGCNDDENKVVGMLIFILFVCVYFCLFWCPLFVYYNFVDDLG